MRNWTPVVGGLLCLCFGALLVGYFGAELGAQQQQGIEESQAWEIYHGRYNNAAETQDDSRFYVVRHNRLTGETQIIACEDRDGCTQLATEVQAGN